MLTGIALILIACYVAMPKAIMVTLCVFGALKILFSGCGAFIKTK